MCFDDRPEPWHAGGLLCRLHSGGSSGSVTTPPLLPLLSCDDGGDKEASRSPSSSVVVTTAAVVAVAADMRTISRICSCRISSLESGMRYLRTSVRA